MDSSVEGRRLRHNVSRYVRQPAARYVVADARHFSLRNDKLCHRSLRSRRIRQAGRLSQPDSRRSLTPVRAHVPHPSCVIEPSSCFTFDDASGLAASHSSKIQSGRSGASAADDGLVLALFRGCGSARAGSADARATVCEVSPALNASNRAAMKNA